MENLNKEKQIEEMARVLRPLTLCPHCLSSLNRDKKRDGGCYKPIGYECSLDRDILNYCKAIYNADFRKQSENTIELPCKVGQEVWYIDKNYTIQSAEVTSAIIKATSRHLIAMRYVWEIEDTIKLALRFDRLNVDYWLSKKEAEEALAKMKGGAE